jgi:hypothetical protein
MESYIRKDLQDQFRDAFEQETHMNPNPYFTCPLCQKCPVCSASAAAQRHRENTSRRNQELTLNMPSNWTQAFISPKRKKQGTVSGGVSEGVSEGVSGRVGSRPSTAGTSTTGTTIGTTIGTSSSFSSSLSRRNLPRSTSTVSVTPSENNKSVKLLDTIEEKQNVIEKLDAIIEEQKTEMNLYINKLQYSEIEIKQNKIKLHQKGKEIHSLQERVRDLECSLKQSQEEVKAARKNLGVSEACRSNVTRELARYRRERGSKSSVCHGGVGNRRSGAGRVMKSKGGGEECNISSDCDENISLDISCHRDVVVKEELNVLMSRLAEWSSSGLAPEIESSGDWLEFVHSEINVIAAKL